MDKKSDYAATMETQMKKWDAEVDALAAAGEKATESARATYQANVKSLRANRDEAQKTFQEMSVAGVEAGEKMRAKMTASWETMQKALEKVSADLRK
jgi:hypothetical protein